MLIYISYYIFTYVVTIESGDLTGFPENTRKIRQTGTKWIKISKNTIKSVWHAYICGCHTVVNCKV